MLKIVVYLLSPIVLFAASYFPFWGIYRVAIQMRHVDLLAAGPKVDVNTLRLEITLAALIVALVLVGLVFLLYWISKNQKLELFERVFKTALYYVPIVTLVMLAGMWLDYQGTYLYHRGLLDFSPPAGEHRPTGIYVRVGFLFFLFHPFK